MSSRLTWRPVNEYKGSLSNDLKRIYSSIKSFPCKLHWENTEDIAFIEGLIAAEVKDAAKLYEILKEHKFIEITETW